MEEKKEPVLWREKLKSILFLPIFALILWYGDDRNEGDEKDPDPNPHP
jgi:hypothetical protein